MSKVDVSVIIPSKGRPAQLVACVERLFETTTILRAAGLTLEVVIVMDDDRPTWDAVWNKHETRGLWHDLVTLVYREHLSGPIAAFNEGLRQSSGELLVTGSDDLVWGDGWLTCALEALDTLPDKDGLVGLNDGAPITRDYATLWLCTRRWVKREQGGCLLVPVYQRQFADPEACIRAQRSGHYVYAEKALVTHRHHLWGTAELDDTYRLNNMHIYRQDEALYNDRFKRGFPDDFEPALPVPQVYWSVLRERFLYDRAARAFENVTQHCEKMGYTRLQARYTATDIARESLTQLFLKMSQEPDDVLVMLDDDHDPPFDIVEQLTNCMGAGVVVALCRMRGDDFRELAFGRGDDGQLHPMVGFPKGAEGIVMPIDSGGAGAIAIRRWVFDQLIEKYKQPRWLWRNAYSDLAEYRAGEETYFMRMCEDAGIPMACATHIIDPHLIVLTVEELFAVAEAAAKGEDWRPMVSQAM